MNFLRVRGCVLKSLIKDAKSLNKVPGAAMGGSRAGFATETGKSFRKKAKLVLEDGTEMEGYSFGHDGGSNGEVVFNTGMVGYPESLTDPSYCGQILTMTYPLIGNYGVPGDSVDNNNLREFFESEKIHVKGLVCQEYSFEYSHWNAQRSLDQWLKEHEVPGIFGIDTRALTKRLREKGSMLGKIITEGGEDKGFVNPFDKNLANEVSIPEIREYGEYGDVHILAIDCGIKHNIIRCLVNRGAKVTVVPWDYDITANIDKYDGLFLSNGPGNPEHCDVTIEHLRKLTQRTENVKPVFGICLGHQLLSLAAGATSYKMKYGHRGHNQPCIDLHDQRCYITSQNHGFAVDTDTLTDSWRPYFVNVNDNSSEGIIHESKPYFSVQFHPEAKGGPEDTEFLFDQFLTLVRKGRTDEAKETKKATLSIGEMMTTGHTVAETIGEYTAPALSSISPKAVARTRDKPPKKVLILGSGGLQIGQAGEFDYSGSQAIKALKEDNIKTVLVNPNIATVQTAPGLADRVYFLPVTPEFVTALIEKEQPDGILLQFGGQTALNCGVELHQSGVLQRNGVQVLGTSVETIIATEDRDEFAAKLTEINEPVANSVACTTVEQAIFAAEQIGYPLICRAAFALGGLGSGFADNKEELAVLVRRALSSSPQVLIEKSMKGWKECEYEVVRDADDNCITVCNMENFDPLGIHTGDSIVIAPSQTLDDHEYHMLRTAAIRIVRHLGVVGECNVQYALNPYSREYCVIEVNPRLSRSSALASKATGYPLAFVAAKLALGKSLNELTNNITKVTAACFEPSLDYVVTKIPRWDIAKFSKVSPELGSSMKSVGEVMAIGRSFEESFQKALRMVDNSVQGFQAKPLKQTEEQFENLLSVPTDQRVFALAGALNAGWSVEKLHELTRIDYWFLHKLVNIHELYKELGAVQNLSPSEDLLDVLGRAKRAGFSDLQIVDTLPESLGATMDSVRQIRKDAGIVPVAKQIDTLGAEYPAQTNYLYTTYNGTAEHDVEYESGGVTFLGGGAYCIGNSVEFDYTAVSAIRTARALGEKTITINYNPETVSTDYDESDRLYFEELSLERVLDITDNEQPKGVVVSVGGQIPNNLAVPLDERGVQVLGTTPEKIDNAEDRSRFSAMCDDIGVDQPEWDALVDLEQAYKFADKVGYPVLVRPSYVLSGAAMRVVRNPEMLEHFLAQAADVSKEHPVVISKFILGSKEIEMDGVGSKGDVVVHAIHEHIEQAGVHSGDASMVFPPRDLSPKMRRKVREAGKKICKALEITGPFNAQFIVHEEDETVKVIECNVRASRSFPFVSKILGLDFIEQATRLMLGYEVNPVVHTLDYSRLDYCGVKAANFSFTRLLGADPILGVEMASTGEVACYGSTSEEAFLKAMVARTSGFELPKKTILLMTGEQAHKDAFLPQAKRLFDMGFTVYGTPGTAQHLRDNGLADVIECAMPVAGDDGLAEVEELLKEGKIDLVINFPNMLMEPDSEEFQLRYRVRRTAVDFSVPLLNNLQLSQYLVDALGNTKKLELKAADEYTNAVP